MTAEISPKSKISKLRFYLSKLRAEKDTLAISLFWEKTGVGSDYRTRTAILDDPGKLKTSHAIDLAKFLSEHFSETIGAENLLEQL